MTVTFLSIVIFDHFDLMISGLNLWPHQPGVEWAVQQQQSAFFPSSGSGGSAAGGGGGGGSAQKGRPRKRKIPPSSAIHASVHAADHAANLSANLRQITNGMGKSRAGPNTHLKDLYGTHSKVRADRGE